MNNENYFEQSNICFGIKKCFRMKRLKTLENVCKYMSNAFVKKIQGHWISEVVSVRRGNVGRWPWD